VFTSIPWPRFAWTSSQVPMSPTTQPLRKTRIFTGRGLLVERPRAFPANVDRIATAVGRAGTVLVGCPLTTPGPEVRPGMTGCARIDLGQRSIGSILLDPGPALPTHRILVVKRQVCFMVRAARAALSVLVPILERRFCHGNI